MTFFDKYVIMHIYWKFGDDVVKTTGVTRPVDKMGRVVIPKEIRSLLNIQNNVDKFEISVEGDKVILEKFKPTCVFCNSFTDTVSYENYTVCKKCIEKLYSIKDSAE